MPKVITTIKGPPKTYKTSMLILVANQEAEKGRFVKYLTGEETEATLRRRGLDERVQVIVLTSADDHYEDYRGKVVSAENVASKTVYIWRVRQAKIKTKKEK